MLLSFPVYGCNEQSTLPTREFLNVVGHYSTQNIVTR